MKAQDEFSEEFLFEKMKPCPFCGKKDNLEIRVSPYVASQSSIRHYNVICRSCCAFYCYAKTKEEVIKKWNKRVI